MNQQQQQMSANSSPHHHQHHQHGPRGPVTVLAPLALHDTHTHITARVVVNFVGIKRNKINDRIKPVRL